MHKHAWTISAVVTVGVLAAGIGLAPASAAAERQHIVLVKQFDVVDPGDLTIARGDEVLWLNTSRHGFTLIFDLVPGAPDTPHVILTSFAATFDRPGTYRYLVTGMPQPPGASVPRPDGLSTVLPVAASAEIGWITVK